MQEEKFNEFDTQFNGATYDEVWTARFQFYQRYGAPNTKTFKEGFKQLSGFINKARINFNFYAWLFGFIYFFVKGMYKAGVSILVLTIVLIGIASFLPNFIGNFISIAVGVISGISANYTYYRLKVLGEDDFNIFKGMRF